MHLGCEEGCGARHASPATVSRGGVLFINESDVGYKPYVESWREKMDATAQSTLRKHHGA